jgi:ankyrin repeat protein
MIDILMKSVYNVAMRRFLLVFLLAFLIFQPTVFPLESEDEIGQEIGYVVFPPQAILNASYMGDITVMKRILETNPDKDVRDSLGRTALYMAILGSHNSEAAMTLLLDHGFDINAVVPSTGFTPLHYCVSVNNANAAKTLLMYNADRNIKDKNGLTPLELATKESKRDIILVLARH